MGAVSKERLFNASTAELERQRVSLEQRSRRLLPDLDLYYRIVVRPGESDAVSARLRALPVIEAAYPEPLAPPPPTGAQSFVELQGYLDPAPVGIDTGSADTFPGGKGVNVQVADIEYSWNVNHEDLSKARRPGAFVPNGTPNDPFSDDNHGTAVLGELVADRNNVGINGIAARAELHLTNAHNLERGWDVANSVQLASTYLGPGDVLLIEQQTFGPTPEFADFVPVEWVPEVYDAIRLASAAGILVVEAAGNGNQDLDDEFWYGDPFPMGKPDSGAIIVGAGAACEGGSPPRSRLGFSTYGSRVNLQGWGECVATAGYGDLTPGALPNRWYTRIFNGTSSASPIVAGAAAITSSVYEALNRASPSPAWLRERLVDTGTRQDLQSPGSLPGHIGPQPNLAAALRKETTTSTFPRSVTVTVGKRRSGEPQSLTADDDRYLEVDSTRRSKETSWYARMTNVPNRVNSLNVTYVGKNTASCKQVVSIRNFTRGTWNDLDQRPVGPTEVELADLVPPGPPADYISGSKGAGEVRVRVQCTRKPSSFTALGDLMKIAYTTQ